MEQCGKGQWISQSTTSISPASHLFSFQQSTWTHQNLLKPRQQSYSNMTSTIQMSDEMLRQYVDGIFQRYDIDRSNTLTLNQLVVFFNDLLASRGATHKMSTKQVQESLNAMDANNDGQITKMELFNALKKMNAQSNIFVQPAQNQNNLYPSLSSITPIKPNKTDQNIGYYSYPETYNGANTGVQYQPKQQQITVSPQSYEAVPYRNAQEAQKHTNPANYVKPRKQKAVTQAYVPMMTTAPMMSPMMGMGYSMGPMGPWDHGPYGPMGMGPGPMGMMGGMGGMGYGMNPFMSLLGGLFGLGRFF